MIKKPGIRAIQFACTVALIGFSQISARAAVLVSGGMTYTSADDLTTSLRYDLSVGGGPVTTTTFSPPFAGCFPCSPSRDASLSSGLNSAGGRGTDNGQGAFPSSTIFTQTVILKLGGAGVFDAKLTYSSVGSYFNPLGVAAIPVIGLDTRFWHSTVSDANTTESGEFGSAGLDLLYSVDGGPKQSFVSFKSTVDANGGANTATGFPAPNGSGETNTESSSASSSEISIGQPGRPATRELTSVAAGDSIQLELDLIAFAMGNFFDAQCDGGAGNVVICAGGQANMEAGQIPLETTKLSVYWIAAPQAVPLPSTFLLASLGLLGLSVFSRRKA